ncbi:MAG: acyl-CoA thioesterase [Deltaproteobacteria bacterium]|nr:acyl-CoA thioesterase [Deltaproteobacteria bacterium]
MKTDKQAVSCEIERRVAFYELDPMQIVWHGNYFNYYEDARSVLFARSGINLNDYFKRTQLFFPIIRTSTKHIYPLRYGDEFICKATLVEARIKIAVDFEIRLKDGGKLCTRGRTEQAAVKAPEMKILYSIPEDIRNALIGHEGRTIA